VDGVSISYNVNTDSIDSILNRITTAVDAKADPTFSAQFVGATDTVEFTGSKPITIGSATDAGNLEQVLKLDQAQINNAGPTPSVVGTSGVGGINADASFVSATNAGYATAVTSGFFTINGVSIAVDAVGDNTNSILAKINASNAGVIASYSSVTNQITLTNKTTGAQSIVIGSAGDTSNFLTEAGLTAASGATTSVGSQAKVQIQGPSGITQTILSNNNQIQTFSGLSIQLNSATTTPVTISVAQNTTALVSSVNAFTTAYNAAITEINADSAPPIVVGQQGLVPLGAAAQQAQSVGGGVLFANADVSTLRDNLTNLVSGFFGSDPNFNSLSTIGLSLSDNFTQISATNPNSATPQTGPVTQTTVQGTDGTFQALDATKFAAALAKNPNAVQALLQGPGGLAGQFGAFLTNVTGLPTLLNSGPVGNIPDHSILGNFEDNINTRIASAQQQAQQLTDTTNQQIANLQQELVNADVAVSQENSTLNALAGFFKNG